MRPLSSHPCPASYLCGLGLLASAGASLVGCPAPPVDLPGSHSDASRWWDVQLPALPVPDGALVVTQVTADGSTSTMAPSDPCADADIAEAERADASADASATSGDASIDAGECDSSVGPGDLVFDEVMISTQSGSADLGQWLEVRSTRSCTLSLLGLHASAPHGSSYRSMDVTSPVLLPPGAFFLIADTTNPTDNHDLPGLVFEWTGAPSDALHKTSDTVTLSLGDASVDTLSYPSKTRAEGASMTFPASCPPAMRADFSNWRPSTAFWTSGLMGTPGAPNTDVPCAVASVPTCTRGRRVGR